MYIRAGSMIPGFLERGLSVIKSSRNSAIPHMTAKRPGQSDSEIIVGSGGRPAGGRAGLIHAGLDGRMR